MKFEVYYQSEDNDEPETVLEFSCSDFEKAVEYVHRKIPASRRTWVLQRRGGDKLLPNSREELLAQIRAGKARFKRGKRNQRTPDFDRRSDEQLECLLAEF